MRFDGVFICINVTTNHNLVQNVVQTWQFVSTIKYNQPTQNTINENRSINYWKIDSVEDSKSSFVVFVDLASSAVVVVVVKASTLFSFKVCIITLLTFSRSASWNCSI